MTKLKIARRGSGRRVRGRRGGGSKNSTHAQKKMDVNESDWLKLHDVGADDVTADDVGADDVGEGTTYERLSAGKRTSSIHS